MALKRVSNSRKQKASPKKLMLRMGPIFTGIKIKNECQYSSLPDEFQAIAAKAAEEGTLDLLDGKLRCKCGASVGAKKSNAGEWYGPTRHTVYKEPRPPARKPGPRK